MLKINNYNLSLIIIMSIFFIRNTATAHEGYFTTYSHEIEKGEIEFMLMLDHTAPSYVDIGEGQHNYLSQMPKIGFNPTEQLELEMMVEAFQEFGTGISKFTGFRFETRYRLFKNEIPLNPTIYFEFENLDPETRFKMETSGWILPPYVEEPEEPKREKILESRLILSQNFKNWNASINFINETDIRSGFTAFGYSAGLMYQPNFSSEENVYKYTCPMHSDELSNQPGACSKCGMQLRERGKSHGVSVGALTLEFLGGLGDTRKFGVIPFRQEHYIQPGIMLHIGSELMLSTAFAFGLSDASDDLVRIMLMKFF